MTIKTKRVLWILISMFVALVVAFMCVMMKAPTTLQQTERTVELTNSEIDYNSILNEFDNVEWDVKDTTTSFTGYQTLDASLFEGLDNVNESDVEQNCGVQVKYDFSYDAETNIVTLSATIANSENDIIEEMYGVAFVNEAGELDAVFYIDDEDDYILLSEMQDVGMIENCGWFSNLFKKVVKAVVVVAAVAVCVATAGAGVAAVIAVGAAVGAASSVATQLIDTGTVDLKTTLVDTALSAIPLGGAGAVVAKTAAKTAAQTATKNAVKKTTSEIKNIIATANKDRQIHILQSKHDWSKISNGKWDEVSEIIENTIKNGSTTKGVAEKVIYTYNYKKETVHVETKIIDGMEKIVDAWVVK